MGWRDLPAGQELDVLIAEQLGWTDIHPELIYSTRYYLGRDPLGSLKLIPGFSTDLNVAVKYLWDADNRWGLYPGTIEEDIRATYPCGECGTGQIAAQRSQPARAICYAFLYSKECAE